jgi:3-hydroxyethyl bacteriochlorophyllide a dehydrogenase
MKTRGIVIIEPGTVRLETLDVPQPGPDEVVTRTLYSGISVGTERQYISGAYGGMGLDVAAHYPFVTGYQRTAVIEQVGSEVTALKVGDRVIAGRARLADPRYKGAGSHIGVSVCAASDVYRLAEVVDPEAAALWVMAGVGLHGARLTNVQAGETVAVIGLGMIGQMAAQAARARGARVIASDVDPRRVGLGRSSADDVFTGTPDDFARYVLKRYPDGVETVVDTGSKVAVWDTCMRMAKREGKINLQGYYPGSFAIDSYDAHVRRVTAFFPSGYDDPAGISQALGDGVFDIAPLITHRFAASEAEAAYRLVIERPWEIVGGVIDWTQD